MTELMTIGEFAAVTWLSPKALRLYDERGLLSPDSVDPVTGYRKYRPEQIATARLITMLRRIEMPLEAIGALLAADPGGRAEQILRYRVREAEQHARRQSLARFLEHAVVDGTLNGEHQPEVSRFEVATRTVPATALLTTTRHTLARDLPDVIRAGAERLFTLAEQRGGSTGQLIVIYHGQVGWESDGPIEACVPIRDRDRAHRVEPQHRELFTRVRAEDVQFPRILASFEAVQVRAEQLGLTPAGPPREVYALTSGNVIPECEVALPVRVPDPPPHT